ncbi:hypothetical protein FF38_02012 [Lucilia cuprina]|uniref:Uncharacterized protein n=1 Tax=Lucilia cuprina TaxID=7375 RepID=A0A0L0BLY7_LUCCU|nr:hypothetical protein FF38_02012 [Lucilia cuprina]
MKYCVTDLFNITNLQTKLSIEIASASSNSKERHSLSSSHTFHSSKSIRSYLFPLRHHTILRLAHVEDAYRHTFIRLQSLTLGECSLKAFLQSNKITFWLSSSLVSLPFGYINAVSQLISLHHNEAEHVDDSDGDFMNVMSNTCLLFCQTNIEWLLAEALKRLENSICGIQFDMYVVPGDR